MLSWGKNSGYMTVWSPHWPQTAWGIPWSFWISHLLQPQGHQKFLNSYCGKVTPVLLPSLLPCFLYWNTKNLENSVNLQCSHWFKWWLLFLFFCLFFLVDLPCFLFYLSFIFPLSDAYSFNFFPSSKHAGFVQAAFAFGEARTLSHSLLPSFREGFQAWAFSRLPFPHCCCLGLGGLLDVGCSAGNILFPPSSHVVSIGWVCFSGLRVLLFCCK